MACKRNIAPAAGNEVSFSIVGVFVLKFIDVIFVMDKARDFGYDRLRPTFILKELGAQYV